MNASMSICKPLADFYGVNNKTEVKIKLWKDFSPYELDNVTLTVKDQFLSRKDQWYFCSYLIKGTAVYPQKYVNYASARCRIKTLTKDGKQVLSGIITPKTSFSFFSKSSHTTIMIEMSKEMYNFDDNG